MEEQRNSNYTYLNERVAVRSVIYIKDSVLLVHSNRGYYKFPGGGVEEMESREESLIREIREETGYVNCQVKYKIGRVMERRIDEYDSNALFQMTSHYYLCELIDEYKVNQELDDYEHEEQFTPVWIEPEVAIKQNQNIIDQLDQNSFLRRENYVLHQLNLIMKRNQDKQP